MAKSGITKGVSWPLADKPISIGRDPGCDISILDGHVSRHHCQIEAVGDGIFLTDLGSRNTTIVNGKPVTRCDLRPGDEIAVGNVRLLVAEVGTPEADKLEGSQPGSTVSIRQSSGFYVRGKRADFLASGRTHTIYDLADLYSISRTMWTAASREELIERAGEWLVDRFSPSIIWLVTGAGGALDIQETYCVPNRKKQQPPREHCERAIQTGDGLLVPLGKITSHAEPPETLLVVPLVVGPETVGAVAIQSDRGRSAYDEADLELLLAVGCVAAPWVHAMATIESLKEETSRLRRVRPESPVLIGSGRVMEDVRGAIHNAAQCDLNVLILGETGSGKDIAARLVHDLGARRKAPFVAVNCAAIPRELFESELFGYERGAFTGAVRSKKGLLDECSGGTLFLDEIGDLSSENQARLLRAIETHAFRRLGGSEEHHVDFRVVSATNRSLTRSIAENSFRSDLYYRLNAIEIAMPPLREHLSDIPELVDHFLHLARLRVKRPLKGITPEALEVLQKRGWPGNIRELRTAVERAAAIAQDDMVRPEDFAESPRFYDQRSFPTLSELERSHILEAIDKAQGNMTEAARLLGIGRTTLYDKLSRYNLRTP